MTLLFPIIGSASPDFLQLPRMIHLFPNSFPIVHIPLRHMRRLRFAYRICKQCLSNFRQDVSLFLRWQNLKRCSLEENSDQHESSDRWTHTTRTLSMTLCEWTRKMAKSCKSRHLISNVTFGTFY